MVQFKLVTITFVVGVFLLSAPVQATVCKTIVVGGKLCQLCCNPDGTACVVVGCS